MRYLLASLAVLVPLSATADQRLSANEQKLGRGSSQGELKAF